MASFTASGGDKIEGAFEMRLGEPFDPDLAKDTSHITNSVSFYNVAHNNETGFKVFTNSFVRVTPKSRKIYSIIANGSVTDKDVGLAQQKIIMGLLNLKYQGVIGREASATNFVVRIDQGNRHVRTRVSKDQGWMIEIEFWDSDLEDAATQEILEMRKQEQTKSKPTSL
jgi:hypothetical protein